MSRRWLDVRAVLLAVALATAAVLPVATTSAERRDYYFFDLTLTSSVAGWTQVFWDQREGFNENDSSRQPLKIEPVPVRYRYMMPMGPVRALRFDPVDAAGEMIVGHARIVDYRDRVVHEFRPEDFQPFREIAHVEGRREWLYLRTTPGATDPILLLRVPPDLYLRGDLRIWTDVAWPAFWKVLLVGLLVGLPPVATALRAIGGRLAAAMAARPRTAVALTALVAVAIQAHPVIFLGRSYASPDNGGHMLYEGRPTVPGNQPNRAVDTMTSDTGALLFQHLYYPMVQRDALAAGELPLWNRYALAGQPLLGQGQSMFGDPFNFITIAADGNGWAWDVRFVLARWLFAAGLGFAVLLLTRHLGAAVLVAGASTFIGFTTFRLAHPANFTVCYSPWILWAWACLIDARSGRSEALALAALVGANWCVMTSGTVKEAYMGMLGLNFAGVLLAAFHPGAAGRRLRAVALATAAGVGFILLTAPLWAAFVVAWKHSFSGYDTPTAFPLPAVHVLGIFDDIFYRQTSLDEAVVAPALNFLFLAGLAWWAVQPARWRADRPAAALLLAAAVPFAFAFGIVPVAVMLELPFIQNIGHIGNTFSCSLIVLLAVVAGFGFRDFLTTLDQPGWWRRFGATVLAIGALTALFFLGARQHEKSPFFAGHAPGLYAAVLAIPVAARWAAGAPARFAPLAVALALGLPLLLWRHAQRAETFYARYAFSPGARVDYFAPSPAIALVNAHRDGRDPGRVVGWDNTLYAAYNTALRWESLYGVDAIRNGHYQELAAAFDLKRVWMWDGVNLDREAGRLVPAHDLLNVTHYVASRREPPRQLHTLQHLGARDLDVYHSPTAWPRAFFTDRLAAYAGANDFVDLVLQGERTPFAAVQRGTIGAPALPPGLPGRTVVPARDYRLTPNNTSFTVEAPGPGVVVLTEAYYDEDFRVTINGAPASYFRVNHAFKGVVVPAAGRYEIAFAYWPQHFTAALWAGGAGLVLLVAGGWWLARRRPDPA